MKRIYAFLVVFIIISTSGISQIKLIIEITEIRNNTGNIMLQVLDENEKIIVQEMSPIKDKMCTFSIPGLTPGKYAVRYYHDENLNGKMDTNLVGKPTEGYGFSNNVVGKFGPPPFEKWLFGIDGDQKITLRPTY